MPVVLLKGLVVVWTWISSEREKVVGECPFGYGMHAARHMYVMCVIRWRTYIYMNTCRSIEGAVHMASHEGNVYYSVYGTQYHVSRTTFFLYFWPH